MSLGLLSGSTLLQLRGELMSDDRSPFFSGGGCRPETAEASSSCCRTRYPAVGTTEKRIEKRNE